MKDLHKPLVLAVLAALTVGLTFAGDRGDAGIIGILFVLYLLLADR